VTPLRIALDHNFPRSIVGSLAQWITEAELTTIDSMDPAFGRLPDWKLLIAFGEDGLVTNDEDFVARPRELVTLEQTRLTAIVITGLGHDPVRALGLLLHKLPTVCGQMTKRRGQLWQLASGPIGPKSIHDLLGKIASRSDSTIQEVRRRYQLTPRQLDHEPLEQIALDE
jgi:hypothetical protein